MNEINKQTRRRITELVTDEEAEDIQLSGDFDSEGILDYFRKAEIWIPTEVFADYVVSTDLDWYGMQFNVAFVPPERQKITWAHVELSFQEPVRELGAWLPNDVFSAYRATSDTSEAKVGMNLGVPEALLGQLPFLKDLLPQLSVEYRSFSEDRRTPMESVIRTASDHQRRLYYDLSEDPKTGIDQRQLVAQILFGVTPGIDLTSPMPLAGLRINCRCGLLRLKSEIPQDLDVTFRRGDHPDA